MSRLNSSEFVNPKTRTKIFDDMREEQMKLFDQRSEIIKHMEASRPTTLNKIFIQDLSDKLENFNEESSTMFDTMVDTLARDMENTNEDIDILEADLLDFCQKNDA